MTPPRVVAESRVLPVTPPSNTPPGRLILRVLVATDGRVAEIEVLRAPYGGEALKDDAIAAARTWRYEPARRDGAVVACWTVESVESVPQVTPPPATPPPGSGVPAPDRPPPVPAAAAPQVAEGSSPLLAGTGPSAPSIPEAAPPGIPAAPPPVLQALPEPPPVSTPLATPPATPRRSSPEPAIDLTRGGPPPLVLGGSGQEAAEFLGIDPAAGSLRAADRGLEVAIVDREGERQVASIRYLFADGRDGFRASSLRTRSGLGTGSACLGIPAAQGRPTTRAMAAEAGGVSVERLRYESDGVVATFLCVDGRLAEMTIAAAERAGVE